MKDPIPFGKYLLAERIDVGGMAEVFVARGPGGERVAVKRLLPGYADDRDVVTMFLDEARIAVQLDHASIVQVHELGRVGEGYYIAMEYVPGTDLFELQARLRERGRRLPVPLAAHVGVRICAALDHAHRRRDTRGLPLGIVHRDVSPQNVLLSFEGEVKLIDFGIARAAHRVRPGEERVLRGKLGYMSPEMARGLPLDRRSDVFAAGTVLHEMLTGERLFGGGPDLAVLDKVRNAEVPPPSRLNPAVPPRLEKAVLRALAREVEERTPWASDLARDLAADADPGGQGTLAALIAELFPYERRREAERLARAG
jgi:eukaryotic-like serine/threonine-protein kinase